MTPTAPRYPLLQYALVIEKKSQTRCYSCCCCFCQYRRNSFDATLDVHFYMFRQRARSARLWVSVLVDTHVPPSGLLVRLDQRLR